MLVGGIETGGTKFICAIGDELGNIIKKVRIDTKSPLETMARVVKFFSEYEISSLGVASFGPLDLDKESNSYGSILNTPKQGWENFNITSYLEKELNVKVYINTDVNGACLGEVVFGSSNKLNNVMYITVGTGIGVGAYINGKVYQTFSHSEMGHIYLKRHEKDLMEGVCPYHKDCFEGLASGPAVEKRFGKRGECLNEEEMNEMLEYESFYIAEALLTYTTIMVPERIIIGGGVGNNPKLLEKIKVKLLELNHGFLSYKTLDDLDNYLINPSLGNDSGIKGAFALALNK